MPTPSPSIIATIVATSGTASTPEASPMLLIPISRPIRATMIGMLIATSEPKATTSTTTATRMPIPSLEGPAAAPA